MRVLRMNKDSVMAMLEAFVHDPLINWRLLNTAEADADNALSTANTGEAHMPGLSSSHNLLLITQHNTTLHVAHASYPLRTLLDVCEVAPQHTACITSCAKICCGACNVPPRQQRMYATAGVPSHAAARVCACPSQL